MRHSPLTCDIFCRVVDNYGDIGVAWRLARQLAAECAATVRLIVDNLATFQELLPSVVPELPEQTVDGVTIIAWREPFNPPDAADLVVEAFACDLPRLYLEYMRRRDPRPVWINLEYLSAETWVPEHHLLPSPHPLLALTKFFFFPGFTNGTGGLIREKDLIARRDLFAATHSDAALRVLVFAYGHAPAEALFSAMAGMDQPVICGFPGNGLAEKIQHWRGLWAERAPGAPPMLEFQLLPFVPQAEFDTLLWQNDVLFVRGEDSFVRAQWAAKPFVWQAYPQSDDAHLIKLDAFLDRYCEGLAPAAEAALRAMWRAWNVPIPETIGQAWADFTSQRPALNEHALRWSRRLCEMPDLASNLLSFYRKNAKLQGFAVS